MALSSLAISIPSARLAVAIINHPAAPGLHARTVIALNANPVGPRTEFKTDEDEPSSSP